MIISFYAASLQLIFSEDDGNYLFPDKPSEKYIRITGDWTEGPTIYRSNSIEYNNRDLPGVFYRLGMTNLSKGQIGIANIGWGILGQLKRADYTIPSRGVFDVEFTAVEQNKVIKVPPLNQVRILLSNRVKGRGPGVKNLPRVPVMARKSERDLLESQEEPVVKPLEEKVDTAPIVSDPPSEPLPEPEPTPEPVIPEPVISNPIPVAEVVRTPIRPPAQRSAFVARDSTLPNKSIEELKGLAAELNKTLVENESLFVFLQDGSLHLEEQIVEYEEF